MAIFGKKQEVAEEKPSLAVENPAPAANEPPARADDGGEPAEREGSRLVVGSNVRLTGSEITDCDTAIVEGRVEATVEGRVMKITETGIFSGTVVIDMAEIRGQFQGELTVRKCLTVCGTGKVKGKIRYGKLVVEEGGELSGDVDSLAASNLASPSASSAKPAIATASGKPEAVSGYSSRGAAG